MIRIGSKRFITHKVLNDCLDEQGKFGLDLFNLYFVIYYKEGENPVKTGKAEFRGFLQDTETVVERVLDDGRDAYGKNRVILLEESVGNWLTYQYSNVFGKGNRDNKNTRVRVNELWWGDSLTKASKNEIKQRLYAAINRLGNILVAREQGVLEEEKKNPPVTYADALTHLRGLGMVNVTLEGVGTFDIWYEEDEYQSGYISEYKGNILYDNARIVLGVTLSEVTDGDRDKVKKVKYKLL